jgi:hypothetical protein
MKRLIDSFLKLECTQLDQICKILLPLVLIYKDVYLRYLEFKLTNAIDDIERTR